MVGLSAPRRGHTTNARRRLARRPARASPRHQGRGRRRAARSRPGRGHRATGSGPLHRGKDIWTGPSDDRPARPPITRPPADSASAAAFPGPAPRCGASSWASHSRNRLSAGSATTGSDAGPLSGQRRGAAVVDGPLQRVGVPAGGRRGNPRPGPAARGWDAGRVRVPLHRTPPAPARSVRRPLRRPRRRRGLHRPAGPAGTGGDRRRPEQGRFAIGAARRSWRSTLPARRGRG